MAGEKVEVKTTDVARKGDSWIVGGKWIAPGRNQREAIDYLKRCGVKFGEIVLVFRFEG